jgi:ubiquinone/menaquinone biosynthesis C-methylase UbiE
MDGRDADDVMRAHFDHAAAGYDDWWLGTGRFAERDRPGWSAEVEQLIGVLQSLPPARVLDVACGTGFLTQHLRGQVVGLDQSAQMVEIAAARMPNARVVQGDIAPLPFDEGEFERVFTSHFFHHLAADRRAAFIAEARRVAHEIVIVEDVRSPDAPKEEWREVELGDGSRDRMHRHAFTAAELVTELGGGQVLHEGRWFVVVAAT